MLQKIGDIHNSWQNHSTTSYQGSGSTDNILKIVETELRLITNNPISYYGLVTHEPNREKRA